LRAPSFAWAFLRWLRTVSSPRPSASATSRNCAPVAAKRSTDGSRGSDGRAAQRGSDQDWQVAPSAMPRSSRRRPSLSVLVASRLWIAPCPTRRPAPIGRQPDNSIHRASRAGARAGRPSGSAGARKAPWAAGDMVRRHGQPSSGAHGEGRPQRRRCRQGAGRQAADAVPRPAGCTGARRARWLCGMSGVEPGRVRRVTPHAWFDRECRASRKARPRTGRGPTGHAAHARHCRSL
jgi:hypothetical protein